MAVEKLTKQSELEAVVLRGHTGRKFIAAGAALKELRSLLGLKTDIQFKGYCKETFNLGPTRGQMLCDMAEIANILGGDPAIESEAQLRYMRRLRYNPEQVKQVWSKAKEQYSHPPGLYVRELANEMFPSKTRPEGNHSKNKPYRRRDDSKYARVSLRVKPAKKIPKLERARSRGIYNAIMSLTYDITNLYNRETDNWSIEPETLASMVDLELTSKNQMRHFSAFISRFVYAVRLRTQENE